MTTTETLDALYAKLEEVKGDDWELYLILADWYEENGLEEVAEALRWQHRERKRSLGTATTTWFIEFIAGEEHSNLPKECFYELTGYCLDGSNGDWRDYETRRQAQTAFYGAYTGAKAKGWKP